MSSTGNTGTDAADDEPDWMDAHSRQQKRNAIVQRRRDDEEKLKRVREKEARMRRRYEGGEALRKRVKIDVDADTEDEASFLLDDYESDEEGVLKDGGKSTRRNTASIEMGLSAETEALLVKLGMNTGKSKDEDGADAIDELKIFYCSRTHSQITQFVDELRRVKLPPGIPYEEEPSSAQVNAGNIGAADIGNATEELKHLTLGSRKNLCINARVNKLGSTTAINERCLELQQPGVSEDSKCPYLPNKDNVVLVNDFRDHALAKIRDIEDFGRLGKELSICPYYASRAAIKPSEIISLPYPLLLQKSAREALSISLKNHIIIIDEAHNLLDAISNIHSVSISLHHLRVSRAQVTEYLQKFRNRLKGKNRVYVAQLVRLVDSLMLFLENKVTEKHATVDGEVLIGELMGGRGVDQINLYKLMRYLQESKLARKVERYAVFSEEQVVKAALTQRNGKSMNDHRSEKKGGMPVLTHVQSFLLVLTNPAAEGRFFYSTTPGTKGTMEMTLKYLLLDPTHHFREVVDEARAVILAGGTMSPMSDYTNHLFQYLPTGCIEVLSCGHVIPSSNLLATPVMKGPSGIDFDFTFENRSSEPMIRELGLVIVQFTTSVPDGLVVFFPSYAYLDTAVQNWQKPSPLAPGKQSLWTLLSSKKRVFLEPRSTSHPQLLQSKTDKAESNNTPTVEKVLAAYTEHINTGAGALLFAVIGGSLSEGINFSDRLGRGIVVVGLPFPNSQSAEWKAKLEFIKQRSHAQQNNSSGVDSSKASNNDDAARDYYENACMRAVNQSVGRAIRHKDDYAAIFLVDRRYERERIVGKLPEWIRDSLRKGVEFREMVRGVEEFFDGKK